MSNPNASPTAALSDLERAALEGLLSLAYASWNLADNTGDDGNGLMVEQADFQQLSDALDRLDELPDDQPGYTMEAAAKARWALRRLLGVES